MKKHLTATKRAERQNNKLFAQADTAWDKGDLRRAFELFLNAAQSGDSSSQLNLGYFFDRGLHIKRDKEKAMYWYRQAYRGGDPSGANNIATLHRERGRIGQMVWWFRRALAMGDDEVLLELGKCYEAGLGLPKSREKATLCYGRILASGRVSELCKERAQRRLTRLK